MIIHRLYPQTMFLKDDELKEKADDDEGKMRWEKEKEKLNWAGKGRENINCVYKCSSYMAV